MKIKLTLQDLLFDVLSAPIEAVVGEGLFAKRLSIPRKKALLHHPTGRVLGVVGADYRVVTNQEALALAHTVCARAFPGVAATEWEPGRVAASKSFGQASIDLQHRTHVLNLWQSGHQKDDPYTPFVRVTNSFNGSRALRFDFGFIRQHCTNGCIFERDLASLVVSHGNRELATLDVKVGTLSLAKKWEQFSSMIHLLKATTVPVPTAHELVATLLTLPPLERCQADWQKAEHAALETEIKTRHARYEIELGANAYAVFNTVTDFAARPPEFRLFNRTRATLEQRAGTWLRTVADDTAKPNPLNWTAHLSELRKALRSSAAPHNS